MVKETGTSQNDMVNLSAEELFAKKIKALEQGAYIAVMGLIVAVILLSFNLRLLSGILIIASAAFALMLIRNGFEVARKTRQSIKDYTSMNEQKDDVIKEFSHKIREPLNNLVVITDMLMESGLQKKQRELLETFVASTKNMITTVNDLTMHTAGTMNVESRKHFRFNLLATIQNTIELYNLKDKANIDFILNKKDNSEFECYGDPIVIKQIFLDLFNTIENQNYDNSTKVTINLKKEKESGNECTVGLRIQTDKSIILIDGKSNESHLAAKLISSGKGTYNQELGKNYTILNITLPFTTKAQAVRQPIASPKIEALMQKDKPKKELKDIKLLLVEDNIINQKITLLTLKPLVSSIDTASNGKEALDKFGSNSYDLILMDIQMPVMSGLIAAEKIRALEASTNTHVPIIAITANAMLGDREKCISAGIDDYISKPFQPSALIEKIKLFF